MESVATDVPTTTGIPYSLAIVAAGASGPPVSVTNPFIFGNTGVNTGDAWGYTSIVSGIIVRRSSLEAITVANPLEHFPSHLSDVFKHPISP